MLSSASRTRVLGLFAKEPAPGRAKTRLAAATSPEWAARVAEAFLLDSLDRLSLINARRIVAFTPVEAEPYFRSVSTDRFESISQGAGDLGTRLAYFSSSRFAEGASAVVLLGTDSPNVPVEWIEEAFRALNRVDVVLGPATDGGYYLIGLRQFVPIFENIAWGTPTVLSDTLTELTRAGGTLELLPPWYDIDTWSDWQMLHGHLRALERCGAVPDCPRTRQVPSFGPVARPQD